jgi:Mn2+/Fe2+ NRAMP family transporter
MGEEAGMNALQTRCGNKLCRTIFNFSKVVAFALVPAALILAAFGAPSWLLRAGGAAVFIALPFVMVLTWALSSEPLEGTKPSPWDAVAGGD